MNDTSLSPRDRTALPRLPWTLALTLAAAAPAALAQTPIYDTGGFEPPAYAPGQLADEMLGQFGGQGQDDWVVTTPGGAIDFQAIAVQTSDVHGGTQAMTLSAATQQVDLLHLRRNVLHGASDHPGEPVVDIRMWMKLDSSASPSEAWVQQAQGGPGPGSGLYSWDVHPDGHVRYVDPVSNQEVDTGFVLTRDAWHDVLTSLDFQNQRVALWVDGQLVFDEPGMPGMAFGLFGFQSFALHGPGDDALHVDDYRIQSRPVGLPDFEIGSPFCTPGVPNSTGQAGHVRALGNDLASANALTLEALDLPPGHFGIFLASQTQALTAQPGGSQGVLCLGGNLARFPQIQSTGTAGAFSLAIDLTAIPTNPVSSVAAGETWSFQAWHRDLNPGQTSNFTDAVQVTFQ